MIEALKDSIDMLNVQLYNSGSQFGLDGPAGGEFKQGNADFVLAMTEAVILGFTATGTIGTYSGFPSNKVGIGLPGCHSSDAVPHKELEQAMNYLIGKGPQPGNYTLKTVGGYPDLLGMMTWSINSDQTCGPSYGFVDTWSKVFTDSSYIEITSGDIYEKLEDGKIIQVNLFKDTYATSLDTTHWDIENLPDGVRLGSVIRLNDTTAQLVLTGNSLADYSTAIWNVKVTAGSSQFSKSTLSLSRDNGIVLKKTRSKIPGIVQCEDLSAKQNAYIVNLFNGEIGKQLRFNATYYADYEVDVTESADYDVEFRMCIAPGNHSTSISIDGVTNSAQQMSSTTAWQVYETATFRVKLDSGLHVLTLKMASGWMNIDWMEFKKADLSGVADINNSNTIIYPNPATNLLHIQSDSFTPIAITDLSSKTVLAITQTSLNSTINIENLSTGIHLIKLVNDTGIVTYEKFLKQ